MDRNSQENVRSYVNGTTTDCKFNQSSDLLLTNKHYHGKCADTERVKQNSNTQLDNGTSREQAGYKKTDCDDHNHQNKLIAVDMEKAVDVNYVSTKNKCHLASDKKCDKDHPGCTKRNVIKTFAAYATFFGAGMGNSIFGATILQLEQLTQSTTGQIASIFLWRALGGFFGTIIVTLLFNKLPPEAILAAACVVLSGMNLAIPWCTSYTVLMTVTFFHGFAHGHLASGCNSFVLKTWRLKSAPFIQALQFVTSFGSTVTPLLADFFFHTHKQAYTDPVSQMPMCDNNKTACSRQNTSIVSDQLQTDFRYMDTSPPYGSNLGIGNTTGNSTTYPNSVTEGLFVPYLVTACIIFVGGLTFIYSLVLDIMKFKKSINRADSFIQQQKEQSQPIKNKWILGLLMGFFLIYGGMEFTYGSWILAFTVKYLGTSFEVGTLVCTCYWGSLAGGRAIAIITSKIFNPEFLNCVNLILATASLAVLTFACDLHVSVVWVCSVLTGLSFSSIFGNCLVYSQRELNVTGRMTGLFVLCLYIGFMIMPAVTGVLFAKFTPMFFPYIMLGGAVTITAIFIFIVYYTRVHVI